MSLEFIKFPSLENTYRQKEIDKIQSMMIQDKWVVTEKVHGANFSFWVTKDDDGSKHPIGKEAVMTLQSDYDIPIVPVIGIFDTLEEALEVNESFDSLLMREGFNGDDKYKEAEGVVIEPNTPVYEPNGSRIYLKKKTKRFLEKSGKPTIKHKQVSTLSPVVKEVLERSTPYICENRFNTVVSKIGEVTIKDIGKVMGLMTQDIIADLEKDLDIVIDQMFENKPDKQSYMKNLQKHVQDFIKPILLAK